MTSDAEATPPARRYPAQDVKILWAFSAGRCSFPGCSRLCIETPPSPDDEHAIVGDIAHIYPHASTGPRHDSEPPNGLDLNSYANWLLLCAVHHRLVDAQPQTYDVPFLIRAKRDHERWVESRLAGSRQAVANAAAASTEYALRDTMLYRVTHRDNTAWTARPTVGTPPLRRWDDPYGDFGVIYAAFSPGQALAEALAPFRVDEETERLLLGVHLIDPSIPDLELPSGLPPQQWLEGRALVAGRLARAHVFDAADAPAILAGLRIPVEGLHGPGFRLTQSVARFVYEVRDEHGRTRFDGIVYPSRTTSEKMIALFADRVEVTPVGWTSLGGSDVGPS